MSAEPKPYNQLYIQAWTILSILVAALIFGSFIFGPQLLGTGHWIWDLIRYLARQERSARSCSSYRNRPAYDPNATHTARKVKRAAGIRIGPSKS